MTCKRLVNFLLVFSPEYRAGCLCHPYGNCCRNPLREEKEISDLQGRNRELEKQIRELEDTDIIGMVRENGMTMEQFAELFRSMQAAPAPAT